MGLGKFWPDLEISEALLMGFEVSFSSDFCVLESRYIFFLPKDLGVSDLSFFITVWSSGVEMFQRSRV